MLDDVTDQIARSSLANRLSIYLSAGMRTLLCANVVAIRSHTCDDDLNVNIFLLNFLHRESRSEREKKANLSGVLRNVTRSWAGTE